MLQSISRRFLSTVLAVAASAVLAACSSTSGDAGPDDDVARRVAAVTETRDAVVEPAQALGTAAAEVASRLDHTVEQPTAATVEALRAAVTDLEQARTEVEELDLEPTTPDVVAADAALDDAMAGARSMAEAATVVATAADQASTADQALAELVATWDEPGSRSELLARLDETALAADALATDGVGTPPEDCSGPLAARVDAAAFVAESSRELRALVEARDGLAFDERRAELATDPLGRREDDQGAVRSIDPDDCPAIDVAEESAAMVVQALQDLQTALNPEDLAG